MAADLGLAIGNGGTRAPGLNAFAEGYAAYAGGTNSIARGTNAHVGLNQHGSIAEGNEAKCPANANGPWQTAKGDHAEAREMRCSAYGAYSLALDVSASAFGFYAWALGVHSLALGRGAISYFGGTISFNEGKVYFLNGWARKYKVSVPVWNDAESLYEHIDASVDRNPALYPAQLFGMSGGDQTNTTTSSIGGAIQLHGGLSTGTAAGGPVEFFTSPAGGVDNNTENAAVKRVSIRSDGLVEILPGAAVAIRSENGTLFKLLVGNDGSLSTQAL